MLEKCKKCISYPDGDCWKRMVEDYNCCYFTLRIEDNAAEKPDAVNHPNHYAGKVEVIEYIRDKLTPEEFVGYCCGNVLKYVSRWRKKDGVQDLKKAEVYLKWMIESAEKETESAT